MKLLFVFVALLSSVSAFATPGQVLIIRHAEKINDDDPDLSERGQQRAQALVKLFTQGAFVKEFGQPVAIFAAAPKHEDSSMRSIETVAPLARALDMHVQQGYTSDEEEDLAQAILSRPQYDGKTVLIAWAHQGIPDLAEALGVHDGIAWRKRAFDRVWKITFDGGKAKLVDLPENLLPGDSH